MSTVLGERSVPRAEPRSGPWIALVAALLLLYVPTYVSLARGLWRDDAYAHGPIVLAVFAWLVWRRRRVVMQAARDPHLVSGFALLLIGLAFYVVGRSQSLAPFEVASHLPVIIGALLVLSGPAAVRTLAFPLFFLAFLIPVPGFILDALTTPLKSVVSVLVEAVLALAGYPVERSGVVLQVGPHQMLVADACSGLNSLYSLFALALLYVHLTGPSRRARIAWLLASIVPIAIAANVVRVLVLVMITYHFGEEAGQGFLHGFAGMLVFVTALAMLLAIDALLRRRLGPPPARVAAAHESSALRPVRASWAPALVTVAAIWGAAIAAPLLKPAPDTTPRINLDRTIPAAFGGWRIDPEIVPVAPAPDVQANLDRIYNQVVSRTYVNDAGERMMLTVAHGGDQSDALKAHRQEACYAAQGFTIHDLEHGELGVAGRSIPVTRMTAVRGDRVEPVTYWFTMGDRVVLGRIERLEAQLAAGFAGRIPDGMLVRVSSISGQPANAFAAQQAFAQALFAAMPAQDAARFVGGSHG